VSRRTRRPELLAAFDRLARRDLRDELAMRAILAAKLRAESTFVDVGANTGQWTKEALRCAPGGRHLAFEPVPALHEEMTRALPEVDVREVALGEEIGTARFCHFAGMPAWSGLRQRPEVAPQTGRPAWIRVRVSRLDDEIGDLAPAVVKIDVEGGELAVLRGATATIARSQPLVVFEHQPEAAALYGHTSSEVWAFFDERGMRIFDQQGGGPYALGAFEAAARDLVVNWLAVP
jgi:FkbM family methyltransferase